MNSLHDYAGLLTELRQIPPEQLTPEQKYELDLLLPQVEKRQERIDYQSSFQTFVREFWEEVPGAGKVQWNWHLDVLIEELQFVAERVFQGLPKLYDVVFNVSPGTSKSTICSILFPAWVWTRFPQGRVISASHTETLVLDLAAKARYVILGERYQQFWPHIQLREDQASKGYYANTLGGDRLTCTVGGKTPTGFHSHFQICDDPIDPKKAVSALELKTAADFMTNVLPSRKVDKAVSVTFLIMQRLHQDDPTGVLLKKSRHVDTSNIKHYCLPGEIYNGWDVSPPELRSRYVDGLMDPVRLPKSILRDFEVMLGAYGYAGQFGQSPIPLGGGMFKPQYFNNRVKAAPYEARRIRYWDRASTKDGGCYTAGVLMALDAEGNYYVEHVVRGQWEPGERNQRIRATAFRDRDRYGPNQEPAIYIEAEGGSSGRDAWQSVARSLAGFSVREDKVTGKKDTRAEPWSCQLAAGNVALVDDGMWDIAAYVEEHVNFRPSEEGPLGRWKDQVDASSGAFNLLTGVKRDLRLRVLSLGPVRQKGLRIVICTAEQLSRTVIEERCLFISITDPERKEAACTDPDTSILVRTGAESSSAPPPFSEGKRGMSSAPEYTDSIRRESLCVGVNGKEVVHGLNKLLDTLHLEFADLDPAEVQGAWQEPIAPYGRLASELILKPEQAKRLWGFILKKRDPPPEMIVVQDQGDRRALSVALALCDTLRLQRQSTVARLDDPDWQVKAVDKPSNNHVFLQVQAGRRLVI